MPSQWATPLRFVSLAGFGELEGLAASNYSDNRLRSGRHPAIRLTTTLSVCLSHSLSPLSRQSYADNAGDRARSPDPRWCQFRALPAWHRDTWSTRPCHAPGARVRLFFGVLDRTSPSDRTAQSGVEACLALCACLDPEKTSARCLRPTEAFSRPALRMQTALLIPSLRG